MSGLAQSNQANQAQSAHGEGFSNDLGFSLIETLVSLVILTLSLTVLYSAMAGSVRNVDIAEDYVTAVSLAESLLNEHRSVGQSEFYINGQFDKFSWGVTTGPLPREAPDAESEAAQDLVQQRLNFLNVVVSWEGALNNREVRLETVVPFIESS